MDNRTNAQPINSLIGLDTDDHTLTIALTTLTAVFGEPNGATHHGDDSSTYITLHWSEEIDDGAYGEYIQATLCAATGEVVVHAPNDHVLNALRQHDAAVNHVDEPPPDWSKGDSIYTIVSMTILILFIMSIVATGMSSCSPNTGLQLHKMKKNKVHKRCMTGDPSHNWDNVRRVK